MLVYTMQPVIHGHIYISQYNNFQCDALYFKFGKNRPLFTDQTITRIAWVDKFIVVHTNANM